MWPYWLNPEFVQSLLEDCFDRLVRSKMVEFGETNAAVCVAIRAQREEFDDCILGEVKGNVDPNVPHSGNTDRIARSKCGISFNTGFSTREVTLLKPDLLAPGDTRYAGSVVVDDLIVATSGLHDWIDELISRQIAAEILCRIGRLHALMLEEMSKPPERGFMPEG